jgi:hypothetical protein
MNGRMNDRSDLLQGRETARGTMTLAEALRGVAAQSRSAEPPATVADAARAALERRLVQRTLPQAALAGTALQPSRPGRGPWLHRLSTWAGATLAFAGVLFVSLLLLLAAGDAPRLAPQQLAFEATDFVPLVPPERWPADTAAGASPAFLVRTELPGQRLAALGLPFDPARAGERRNAELLVHPSGEVLAVRVVP